MDVKYRRKEVSEEVHYHGPTLIRLRQAIYTGGEDMTPRSDGRMTREEKRQAARQLGVSYGEVAALADQDIRERLEASQPTAKPDVSDNAEANQDALLNDLRELIVADEPSSEEAAAVAVQPAPSPVDPDDYSANWSDKRRQAFVPAEDVRRHVEFVNATPAQQSRILQLARYVPDQITEQILAGWDDGTCSATRRLHFAGIRNSLVVANRDRSLHIQGALIREEQETNRRLMETFARIEQKLTELAARPAQVVDLSPIDERLSQVEAAVGGLALDQDQNLRILRQQVRQDLQDEVRELRTLLEARSSTPPVEVFDPARTMLGIPRTEEERPAVPLERPRREPEQPTPRRRLAR